MRPPTPDEAAGLTVPELLHRVRDSRWFSLERPATAADLAAGEAAWRDWFGIAMPAVYRELLATTNGLDVNGLLLVAAEEYTVVEDGGERWLPGIASENADHLFGIADQETRRFFGSADDDLFAYDTASQRWLVVDRSNWSGAPLEEFSTLEELLVDRLFRYLED